MVRRAVGIALLPLLAAAMGCETTQPTAKSASPAQVSFRSVADQVPLFEVWDATRVTLTEYPDQPGRPPDQTVEELGLWCDINQSFSSRNSVTYPMRYSVAIERIPTGTATAERLSGTEYASALESVTPYDETAPEPPTTHAVEWSMDLSDPSQPDTTVTLSLRAGRRISAATRDYVEHAKVPSGTYGSRCPNPTTAQQLGPASVAGSESYFSLDVNAGDTVVVTARKDPNPVTTALFSGLATFQSEFYLDGRNVSNSVTGNMFSPAESQDGISYSFTLR